MRNTRFRFQKYWTIAEAGQRLFGANITESYRLFRGGIIQASGRPLRVNIASMLARMNGVLGRPTLNVVVPQLFTQGRGGPGSNGPGGSGDYASGASSEWLASEDTNVPPSDGF